MALLVTVLVVVRDILVQVLESPPAVEVVPEVVEVLDLFPGRVLAAERRDGVGLGEASLRLEDVAPELVEVALGKLLLGRGVDIRSLVNRVELAAADRVEEDLSRLLDALEEVIVISAAGGGLLVGVVLQDLLAVGALDLVFGGLPPELGDTENLVVVLALSGARAS